jgi:hypothetical protein
LNNELVNYRPYLNFVIFAGLNSQIPDQNMVTCSLKEDSTECEIKDVEESRREPCIDDSSSHKHSNENATIEQPSSVNGNSEPPAPSVRQLKFGCKFSKMTSFYFQYAERHLHPITYSHYSFVDRDDKILTTIDVYMKSIEKESLSVEFKKETVTVVFRTRLFLSHLKLKLSFM